VASEDSDSVPAKTLSKTEGIEHIGIVGQSKYEQIKMQKEEWKKSREKQMFKLDGRSSVDLFGLPGKPEQSAVLKVDSGRKTKSPQKIKVVDNYSESSGDETNEFSFLPSVMGNLSGSKKSEISMKAPGPPTIGAGKTSQTSGGQKSDVDEISHILKGVTIMLVPCIFFLLSFIFVVSSCGHVCSDPQAGPVLEEIDFILLKEMGESPLMAGVFANHIETVKLLIFHGGNVDAR